MMLRACYRHGGVWELAVEFAHEWACKWPRPTFPEEEVLRFSIDSDLAVDITKWQELIAEEQLIPRGHAIRKWWKSLGLASLDEGCSPQLDHLLIASLKKQELASLASQVLWQIALRFDSQVMADNPCKTNLATKGTAEQDLRDDSRKVDLQLARYIESCKVAIGKPLFFGLACDKASVKGMTLSNAVGVSPTGEMAVLPPQVLTRAMAASGDP